MTTTVRVRNRKKRTAKMQVGKDTGNINVGKKMLLIIFGLHVYSY